MKRYLDYAAASFNLGRVCGNTTRSRTSSTAPLRTSPEALAHPSAPSTPAPPPQAARRNPTILLPGVRTLATWGTWRLSVKTGVGDRRGIMDSLLCQAAHTVAVVRAQARVALP